MDERIEICRKKINILENHIKLLYERWFVQYDFPDENGNPYKSSGGEMIWNEIAKKELPTHWNVCTLADLLILLKDGTHNPPPRIDAGIPLLTGTMFDKNFLNNEKATFVSYDDYKQIHSTYMPLAGDVIITKIGTIGNVNYLREQDVPIAIHCNSALLRFKKPFDCVFGFSLMKSSLLQKRIKKAKGQSVQEFISLDALGKIQVEQPSCDLVEKFNKNTASMLQNMECLSAQIKTLKHIRDWLLPMLMNGQITVE